MVKIYSLQLVMTTVAVETNAVGQMLKMHSSFVKVSVAVGAGADDRVLLPCLECCKGALQPHS